MKRIQLGTGGIFGNRWAGSALVALGVDEPERHPRDLGERPCFPTPLAFVSVARPDAGGSGRRVSYLAICGRTAPIRKVLSGPARQGSESEWPRRSIAI